MDKDITQREVEEYRQEGCFLSEVSLGELAEINALIRKEVADRVVADSCAGS